MEFVIKRYFENYIKSKKKLIIFLINTFALFFSYYNSPFFEILGLLNKDKIETNKNFINKIIEIDNKINESYFEDNIDFSNYSTQIKALAIYFPNIYLTEFSRKIIRETKAYNDRSAIIKKYYQKKYKINQYQFTNNNKENSFDKNYLKSYNFPEYRFITKQMNLAKSHGLYGFAFYIFFFLINYFLIFI